MSAHFRRSTPSNTPLRAIKTIEQYWSVFRRLLLFVLRATEMDGEHRPFKFKGDQESAANDLYRACKEKKEPEAVSNLIHALSWTLLAHHLEHDRHLDAVLFAFSLAALINQTNGQFLSAHMSTSVSAALSFIGRCIAHEEHFDIMKRTGQTAFEACVEVRDWVKSGLPNVFACIRRCVCVTTTIIKITHV